MWPSNGPRLLQCFQIQPSGASCRLLGLTERELLPSGYEALCSFSGSWWEVFAALVSTSFGSLSRASGGQRRLLLPVTSRVYARSSQVMMGSVQAPEPTQACYHRNHYCEVGWVLGFKVLGVVLTCLGLGGVRELAEDRRRLFQEAPCSETIRRRDKAEETKVCSSCTSDP